LARNRVNQLESKIANLKIDFEHLDMIYNNSSCSEANSTSRGKTHQASVEQVVL